MKNEDQKERSLIFGFLRKILRKEEIKDFNTLLEEDSFQDKVSEETISQYGRNQLKSKLENIHSEVVEEQKKNRFYLSLLLIIMVMILAFAGWKYLSSEDNILNLKPEQVYVSYFEPYPNLYDQKGNTALAEEGLILAMEAYAGHNYSKAIELFESEFVNNAIKNSLVTFYYGNALLADHQNAKARGIFEKLNNNSNALLPEATIDWYLALTYISQNNVEQARPILEELASKTKNSFKQKEAKDILQKLNI